MKRLQTKLVADMSRYTENFFCGMTPRQTVFGAAALAVMVGGSLLLHIPGFLCVLLAFPVLLAGFFRPDGLPLEKWLAAWIESKWRNPTIRTYEPENDVYDFLWRGIIRGRKYFDPWTYLRSEEGRSKDVRPKSRRKMSRGAPPEESVPRKVPDVAAAVETPIRMDTGAETAEDRLAADFARIYRQGTATDADSGREQQPEEGIQEGGEKEDDQKVAPRKREEKLAAPEEPEREEARSEPEASPAGTRRPAPPRLQKMALHELPAWRLPPKKAAADPGHIIRRRAPLPASAEQPRGFGPRRQEKGAKV